MLSTKKRTLLAVLGFCALFLITRLPFLGYDEINPDAVNWHFRSEQFIVGLKNRDFLKTYQHYHPGVTLMWTMGAPIEIYRQINPQDRIYNENNFVIQHRIAKYSLVLVQLALSVVLIFALKGIFGLKKALLGVSLFSFEPWFLGNSRLLHMDVLLSLFAILALTFAYKYFHDKKLANISLSGLFCGLAFLTKSVGALLAPMIIVFWAAALLGKSAYKKTGEVLKKQTPSLQNNFLHLAVFLLSAGLTVFALFPALWQKPAFVLSDIYNEGLRIGARRGHEQLVLGKQVDKAGPIFYPLVIALKTSPLTWLGIMLLIYHLVKNRPSISHKDKSFILLLSAFYMAYFLGMSFASKKIDRYMVPLFPYLGVLAGLGIMESFNQIRTKKRKAAAAAGLFTSATIFVLYPIIKNHPYQFTYTNPLFGPPEQANKLVGQKPFGMGIWELKKFIEKKYGKNIPLGFIDRKPMSMIYPNSKLFDIRETGTGKYDLIILGPNESFPSNVAEGRHTFAKTNAIYINGLEFWRIYAKQE